MAPSGPDKDHATRAQTSSDVPIANSTKDFMTRHKTAIASAISSIIATTSSAPLDAIKTRMQTTRYADQKQYGSLPSLACARQMYATEGYRVFMRGVLSPLTSITFVRMVSMTMYQESKISYSRFIKRNFGVDPLKHANTPGNYPNPATIACYAAAGATAGFGITAVSCPFELVKIVAQLGGDIADRKHQTTRPQAQAAPGNSSGLSTTSVTQANKKIGSYQAFRTILRNRGVAGLYSGFSLHLTRDTIGTAIYFGTYESVRQILSSYSGIPQNTSTWITATAGGMCGLTSWVLIYPVDIAKTQYQKQCLMTYKGEKIPLPKIQFFTAKMYRGLGISLFRSAFLNSIFFYVFEALRK